MGSNVVSFVINHGGKFVFAPVELYEGGHTTYHFSYDADHLSYFELLALVKEVNTKSIAKMYYRVPGQNFSQGLKCIYDDKEIEEVKEHGTHLKGFIEIYVEHKEVGKVNGNGDENICTQVQGNNTGNEHESDQMQDSKEGGNDLENEWEVASTDHVSDDEDEVIEARGIMNNYYAKKKGTKKVVEQVVIEKAQQPNDAEQVVNEKARQPNEAENQQIRVEKQQSNVNEQPRVIDDMLNELRNIGGAKDVSGYHSDYDEDSDYETHSSDSEDSEVDSDIEVDKAVRYPIFDSKIEWDKIEPVIGYRATNCDEMKHAITSYAVANGYDLTFKKRDSTRLIAVCVQNCPWRVHASWMQKHKTFQIKTLTPIHTCVKKYSCKLVTAKWLARQYAEKIRDTPRWRISEFKADVLRTYKVIVTESMCLRARKKALTEVQNALKQHYARLWDYGAELDRTNPGSTIRLSPQERVESMPPSPPVFERAYFCFDALKKGWLAGCRPVIGLDGCFLKTFCKGQLLAAVGRDGNNHMFPIAWAVVESENFKSWNWFLSLLKEDLGSTNGNGWTIMTDRQKGLMPAIQQLLPDAEHRCCARHIYANFRKQFTGVGLRNLFWISAKCGTHEEFEKTMDLIKETSVEAYDYLQQSGPHHWCRAYFDCFSSCENVENNLSETFNAYILEARHKPLINMLEEIRQALMKRLVDKREMFGKLNDTICPRIRKKLEVNKDKFRMWSVLNNGEGKFEVTYGTHGFAVHLANKSCSCRIWQLSGIPCPHAIAAIYFIGANPDDYVSSWLRVDVCLKAYDYSLQPVNGERLWPKTPYEPFQPPPKQRKIGRPQRRRRKEKNEQKKVRKKTSEISRKGRQMRCTNCDGVDHNSRGCKQPRVENDPRLNRRRKQQTMKKNHSTTTTTRPSRYTKNDSGAHGTTRDPPVTQSPMPLSLTSHGPNTAPPITVSPTASTISIRDHNSSIRFHGRMVMTQSALVAKRDSMIRNLQKPTRDDFQVSLSAPVTTSQFKTPRRASPKTAISKDSRRSSPSLAEKRKRLDLD